MLRRTWWRVASEPVLTGQRQEPQVVAACGAVDAARPRAEPAVAALAAAGAAAPSAAIITPAPASAAIRCRIDVTPGKKPVHQRTGKRGQHSAQTRTEQATHQAAEKGQALSAQHDQACRPGKISAPSAAGARPGAVTRPEGRSDHHSGSPRLLRRPREARLERAFALPRRADPLSGCGGAGRSGCRRPQRCDHHTRPGERGD